MKLKEGSPKIHMETQKIMYIQTNTKQKEHK